MADAPASAPTPPRRRRTPTARVIAAALLQRALNDADQSAAAAAAVVGSRVSAAKLAQVQVQYAKLSAKLQRTTFTIVDRFANPTPRRPKEAPDGATPADPVPGIDPGTDVPA